MVQILTQDQVQAMLYENDLEAAHGQGKTLIFSHGFNIHFGQIVPAPKIDVIMVAPKGPGHLVRSEYEEGAGVPCLVAVEQDATGKALETALAYAKGIGATRAGVMRDHLPGRDRDRPVRRAGRALRRRLRAGQGRLRNPGRGGLPRRSPTSSASTS